MTDTSKKPRTWTIVKDRHQIGDSNNYEVAQVAQGEWIANDEKVKVIEHSAYEHLDRQSQQDRLMIENLLYENDKLRAKAEQCEKLAKALENLSEPCTRTDYKLGDLDKIVTDIARQALAEFKKFKEEL